MESSDDISRNLGAIRTRLLAPIRSTLLEIQVSKAKSIEWISNLDCLSIPPKAGKKRRYGDDGEFVEMEPQKTILRKCKINPFEERNYVAVSWVWEPGPGEGEDCERYLIESREGGQQLPSKVRDIVLDRVMKYVKLHDYKYFWIDGICINQEDNGELEVATQAMDLVYSLSERSLAIINKRIETEKDLDLLTEVMVGGYLDCEDNLNVVHEAGKALKLVQWLTSADWWLRAWCFQEDYKASVKMVLLISHDPFLERRKRSIQIFGSVPGELCVNSADFRTVVTRLCQAYAQEFRSDQQVVKLCDQILERAGKYTIRVSEKDADGDDIIRQPMSPTILADIGARQITKYWDRLAIVANCCNYDIRLNANELSERKFSQSLAILTQHLLNGEIFNNGQNSEHSPTQNILDFLKNQSLNSFKSPIKEQLTFIKGCRFPKVELVNEGVQTSGHLWKLGKRIEAECEVKLPGEDSTPDGLEGHQRYRLKQLAHELGTGIYGRGYEPLADDLLHYLDDEAGSKDSFAARYMYWMANEIFYAMTDRGKVLRLGCLAGGSTNKGSHCHGIFVCDADDEALEYVFTTYSQSKGDMGEIDKYVSLGVQLLNPNAEGLPELITKRWVNGLYFASVRQKRKILLPWPEFLKV